MPRLLKLKLYRSLKLEIKYSGGHVEYNVEGNQFHIIKHNKKRNNMKIIYFHNYYCY